MNKEYLVTWSIEVSAENVAAAVYEAMKIQRDPYGTSTVFKVQDAHGNVKTVDTTVMAVITNFKADDPMSVGYYNKANYPYYEAARAEGATYEVPSDVSLYGSSGLHDIQEMQIAMNACIGGDSAITLAVYVCPLGMLDVEYVSNCIDLTH